MFRYGLALMAFSLGLAFAADTDTLQYRTYANGRFAYAVDYPAGWRDPEPSQNGDGAQISSLDGSATLSAFGWRAEGSTIELLFANETKDTSSSKRTVTYKVQKSDWYALSGYEGDNIFYKRVILREGRQAGYLLIFPKARKAEFDPVIAHLSKSLIMMKGGER